MTDRNPPDASPSADPSAVRIPVKKCPICGKQTEPRYRPFCSKRCADVDLGRWVTGSYKVETNEQPGMDDLED
jgi:endogenous inhibitor of DNA gyrase (YacG/DUF329 family)